jgi:phosphoribosylformylglycinamidine cyclo-ligase
LSPCFGADYDARMANQHTYRSAGVDLELYEQAMDRLPPLMRRTHTPRVIDLVGGFAGLFRLQGEGRQYRDPVLVSGTDGVGTKIKVAIRAGRFNTIGIDLVAMCVNDCLCLGAEPLFFLDYLALGKDDPPLITVLVEGVSEGCVQSGSALLGGETAIMPDLYAPGEFDMAGFSVGVVERDRTIDGSAIRPGDVAIGLASSGFHSNGYSLIRKVVFDSAGLEVSDTVPELGRTVGDALLEPTIIYANVIRDILQFRAAAVHGLAHITGGGLADNVERILPPDCRLRLRGGSWQIHPVFPWLQRLGKIDQAEMFHVFNMGIGFVLIVDPGHADAILQQLATSKQLAWIIGEVTSGERSVEFV